MNYEYYVADETPTIATVRFEEGGAVHIRSVSAVFTDGEMDVDATEKRIEEVGRGVSVKIELGVIDGKVSEDEDEMFYKIKADPSISRMPDPPESEDA